MIEWWQAVLIGLAPSLVTAAVALLVQSRQQRNEAARHARQLQADRHARREEALRAHLKQQAVLLEEFLEVVEKDQGRRFLRGTMEIGTLRERVLKSVEGHMDGVSFDAAWTELVKADTSPPERWQDVVKKYSGRIVIMGDVELRDELVALLVHIAAGEEGALSRAQVSTLLRNARARIAQTIVDAPLDDDDS